MISIIYNHIENDLNIILYHIFLTYSGPHGQGLVAKGLMDKGLMAKGLMARVSWPGPHGQRPHGQGPHGQGPQQLKKESEIIT